jgi:hypothetical protein
MPREHPRFQFSLRRLFIWVLALSVMLGLTRLPVPMNVYFTPLYWAALFAYAGSRSLWLAALMGGLGSLAGLGIVMVVDASAVSSIIDPFFLIMGAGCCFPPGAYVGAIVGLLAREHRNEQRFRARLAEVCKEIAQGGVDDPTSE